MSDQNPEPVRTGTSRAIKIALVGAGIAAGAIGATALGASAATTTTTGTGYSAASGSTAVPAAPGQAAPGTGANQRSSTPVRTDEKSVSSSIASTLKAKALAAVPGGTVYRVETDAGDAAYEAHMTKADGSQVTVKFDKNLNVTKVETGMGQGDPAPANGAGGVPNGAAPNGH